MLIKKQNQNKARYDLHVVHKVPSELVRLEQKLRVQLPLANTHRRETAQACFPQLPVTRRQVSFECLCYSSKEGNTMGGLCSTGKGYGASLTRSASPTLPQMSPAHAVTSKE